MINELYHHGIKGQRWGIRKENLESDSSPSEKQKQSTNMKKIAGITVGAVAGLAITAVGASTVYSLLASDSIKRTSKAQTAKWLVDMAMHGH